MNADRLLYSFVFLSKLRDTGVSCVVLNRHTLATNSQLLCPYCTSSALQRIAHKSGGYSLPSARL